MANTDLTPGETVWTIGLDSQCRPIVSPSTFVRIHSDGRPIIQTSDGLRVIYVWHDLYKSRADAERSANNGEG